MNFCYVLFVIMCLILIDVLVVFVCACFVILVLVCMGPSFIMPVIWSNARVTFTQSLCTAHCELFIDAATNMVKTYF
jgi:hypothetical protein